MFVLYYNVSDKRTLCFVFDCNIGEKCSLYLYFVVTSVISARSVLYLFFYVIDKRTLYLYYIVTIVISARSVFYFIATLVISANYIGTSLLRK